MPRKLHATIENRTNRLSLSPRRKPYGWTAIAPRIRIGYRRNKRGTGSWVVAVADGKGGEWTARVGGKDGKHGAADDFEAADGEYVLDFWQAIEAARKRGRDKLSELVSGQPATVAAAVDEFERDLTARGASVANAGRIRKHLTSTLASQLVAELSGRELAAWRDALLAAGMKPATAVRLCKATKAALNLAARRDHRIRNRAAWHDGLSGLAENFATRNIQRLDDEQVHAVISAAYQIDAAFGLYVEVAAVTGARLSQIARLTVADLQADNGAPRLLMPTSRKGRSRKPGKRPVPITVELAAKLKSNRPAAAPLLLRADGSAWQSSQDGDHERLYRLAAERAGVAGRMYALRHSSIIRSLLANVPARVVAATHDTSIVMLERTYSAYIADHADTVARRGLLADNSVSLRGR